MQWSRLVCGECNSQYFEYPTGNRGNTQKMLLACLQFCTFSHTHNPNRQNHESIKMTLGTRPNISARDQRLISTALLTSPRNPLERSATNGHVLPDPDPDPAPAPAPDRPKAISGRELTLQRMLRAKCPLKVAVHGCTGKIGGYLVNRIAVGDMFGKDQPVILRLLGRRPETLEGMAMQIDDSAHGLVAKIEIHTNLEEGFLGTDYAVLTAGSPRSETRPERKHLVQDNAPIYASLGKALNASDSRRTKITVVGNPANTNAWVLSQNAPRVPTSNITAMVRLDENRAKAEIAKKIGMPVADIAQIAVWGNHSENMYPDCRFATAQGHSVRDLIADPGWEVRELVPKVAQRGKEIFKKCGTSSDSSAANAVVDHVNAWHHGTGQNWTTMAVQSQGEYGVKPGLWVTYPVTVSAHGYHIVENLDISDEHLQARLKASVQELVEEQATARKVLQ
jgi:malate dehydrogenase